jgi:urea transport system substrate-binding protein
MEAAYCGLHMWARAVEAAGSDRAADIRKAFVKQQYAAPEGLLTISSENRHAARMALIGQVDESLEFDVVWNSPKPIPPEPFPASRTKAEWEAWLKEVERRDPTLLNPEGP